MVGLGASTVVTWATEFASTAAASLWYLTMVLAVHATSAEVSGLPSDHLAPECSV